MNNTDTLTWSDILQNNILENVQSDISLTKIGMTLAISFLISFFIYILYKRIFSGVLYSKSFNISLIGLSLITSVIIMAINSNLILSLGMVGALSIVRFRTPIKDPSDLIFLFWALAVGIITGAGFYTLAIVGSIIIGLVLFFFMKKTSFEQPYLLVVNCQTEESEKAIYETLRHQVKRFNVKQKTISNNQIELTLEVRLKEQEPSFVNRISSLPQVDNAVLISFNGDYVV